jgi:putative addiction module component (TIGR02574 family)
MSKAEILKELPALQPDDRREIFERLCDLEERDLLAGLAPTAAEKALLDREMEDYRKNPDAGSSWTEVEARLRGPSEQ